MTAGPPRSGQIGPQASRALMLAARFASDDKTRPIITAVMWRGGHTKDTIIATDTYRAYRCEVTRDNEWLLPTPGECWLLPAQTIEQVTNTERRRLNPLLTVTHPCPNHSDSEYHVAIRCDVANTKQRTKDAVGEVITGVYPHVEDGRIIPDYNKEQEFLGWSGEVPVKGLYNVLPHLRDVNESHSIKFSFDNEKVSLQAEKKYTTEDVTVEANVKVATGNGRKTEVELNGYYISDIVELLYEQNSTGMLQVQVPQPEYTLPVRMDGEWGTYVVMGMAAEKVRRQDR